MAAILVEFHFHVLLLLLVEGPDVTWFQEGRWAAFKEL